MKRSLLMTVLAVFTAIPAFSNTRQPAVTTPSTPAAPPTALHMMSDSEFVSFLKRLDTEMVRSQTQLRAMDLRSLSRDAQESEELLRSYNRSLESLDNARDEVRMLMEKQTLRLDLFLLIDLNELARSLDALDQGLVSPGAVGDARAIQKSVDYGRQVLSIDSAIAHQTIEFQHHFLAFTGVIDAAIDQAESGWSQPQSEK
jgi:hypothetical protein